MATPSIQTLITQAQQVLNLQSSNEIRATLAAVLANANVGTPLNPNLTTQQLWNEFGEIVRQSTDDIMSIITDQMMRMVFSPPAPGGAGADKQVIFNDGGVLAGDAGLMYNKATDALTITGDLTVDTSTLKVDSTNNRVGVVQATPLYPLHLVGEFGLQEESAGNGSKLRFIGDATKYNFRLGKQLTATNTFEITPSTAVGGTTFSNPVYTVSYDGIHTFLDGAGGTRMTLNSTGLGIGTTILGGQKLAIGSSSDTSATTNGFNIVTSRATFATTCNGAVDAAGTTINYSWANGGQGPLIFRNAAIANVMTLDASGNLLVGLTSGTYNRIKKDSAADAGNAIFELVGASNATSSIHYSVSSYNANAANAASKFGRDGVTTRSINAGGTVNASGADYAEYMVKCGDFVLSKGDVAGIDANGKLTNVFADAVSFVVKSTDPSYVGNDKWGIDLEGDALEAARQLVDRIAFAGQVPVNVTGANAGDYIVPVINGTGIKGISVNKPTFEQYQLAVGKVIAIDTDGRARIIVKVA